MLGQQCFPKPFSKFHTAQALQMQPCCVKSLSPQTSCLSIRLCVPGFWRYHLWNSWCLGLDDLPRDPGHNTIHLLQAEIIEAGSWKFSDFEAPPLSGPWIRSLPMTVTDVSLVIGDGVLIWRVSGAPPHRACPASAPIAPRASVSPPAPFPSVPQCPHCLWLLQKALQTWRQVG